MNAQTKKYLMIAGGLALVGIYAKQKAGEAVDVTLDAVNPVSSGNLFYRGANEIGRVVTGREGFVMSDLFCSVLGGCEADTWADGYGNVYANVGEEQRAMLEAQLMGWD